MAINFFEIFQNLGLTQSETKTYFASFQLGPSSIQEIAKRAKLSRTAVYDAVSSLQKRGILSTAVRGKKTIYTAEDPERVIAHFKARIKEMEGQIDVLQGAQSELSLLGGGERPTVRFFEGEESVRALFADVAVSGASVLREVSNLDLVHKPENSAVILKAQKQVQGKNIKAIILYTGKYARIGRDAEFHELPEGIAPFSGDMWIYGNRVAFFDLADKSMAVIIENEAFADTARALFDAYIKKVE
jgi:predicted DNA-binding transcriptional regulator